MSELSTTHTLDGVRVTPGLHVWDYDLRHRIVGDVAYTSGGDPWYRMLDPQTKRHGSDMNPSRMWVRHPATGATAGDFEGASE